MGPPHHLVSQHTIAVYQSHRFGNPSTNDTGRTRFSVEEINSDVPEDQLSVQSQLALLEVEERMAANELIKVFSQARKKT